MAKKSIRFYNDYKVRAVWDDDHSKWWFSATDIVRAINDEPDRTRTRLPNASGANCHARS